MFQVRLKFSLSSMTWFALAMAVLADYLRIAAEIEALREKTGALCIYWVHDMPTWVVPLFIVAGMLTLFGCWRSGTVIGLPTAVYTFYRGYLAYAQRAEYARMTQDLLSFLAIKN